MNPVSYESEKKLYFQYCNACHENKGNLILPEKKLDIKSLENFGIRKKDSLEYQIRNGKNGMPSFELRLTNFQIKAITKYLTEQDF